MNEKLKKDFQDWLFISFQNGDIDTLCFLENVKDENIDESKVAKLIKRIKEIKISVASLD